MLLHECPARRDAATARGACLLHWRLRRVATPVLDRLRGQADHRLDAVLVQVIIATPGHRRNRPFSPRLLQHNCKSSVPTLFYEMSWINNTWPWGRKPDASRQPDSRVDSIPLILFPFFEGSLQEPVK
jgi:hypothetical protein